MASSAAKKSRREFYMKITILGSGCSKCRALYATLESALKERKINAGLAKEENIIEILKYGAVSLPAVAIDGKVVAQGGSLTKKDIDRILSENIQ